MNQLIRVFFAAFTAWFILAVDAPLEAQSVRAPDLTAQSAVIIDSDSGGSALQQERRFEIAPRLHRQGYDGARGS